MSRRVLFSFATLLGLCACAPVDVLNATVPRDGYTLTRDIAYGTNPRQTLDIYSPTDAKGAPVILFFYGGSWQFGSKDDYRFLGEALTSKGFVTVVANYRLYPEVRYPAFVEDGARALRHVHDSIAAHGGDPERIFVAGHSAGAYIAMMLGADDAFHATAGSDRAWIRGTIGISGPYDFLPFTDEAIKDIFSTFPDKQTQPLNHITGSILCRSSATIWRTRSWSTPTATR